MKTDIMLVKLEHLRDNYFRTIKDNEAKNCEVLLCFCIKY